MNKAGKESLKVLEKQLKELEGQLAVLEGLPVPQRLACLARAVAMVASPSLLAHVMLRVGWQYPEWAARTDKKIMKAMAGMVGEKGELGKAQEAEMERLAEWVVKVMGRTKD